MNYRKAAEEIFLAGVEYVTPEKLMHDHLKVNANVISIGDQSFYPEKDSRLYIIGAGKASAEMAKAAEEILGSRISGGQIIVKYGHSCDLKYIAVNEAAHPVPDKNGFEATQKIIEIAHKATSKDLVICLISGGGSALLVDYPEGSSPREIMLLNDLLVKSGATIQEINVVRKHLSKIKGGGLSRILFPATTFSLILSDVLGDPLDIIASGPTVADPSTYSDALNLIRKYRIEQDIPEGLMDTLRKGEAGICPETPKPDDPVFSNTYNIIVGNNRMALEAALVKADSLGFESVIINDNLRGNTVAASEYIVEQTKRFKLSNKPACLLFGGETTLKVTGNGMGGRNQHLALAAALLLTDFPGIIVLSAGTDGNDGPTDATGAIVDYMTVKDALSQNIDARKYLSEFDSYNFFRQAGGHIITGPTRTNVMDLVVVIKYHD